MANSIRENDSTKKQRQVHFRKFFKKVISKRETGVLIAIILIAAFFSIVSPQFVYISNIINILRQGSVLGIMTLAVTFLIISGEFDLSIGSTFATAPVIAVELMLKGFPLGAGLFIGFLIGPVFGLINGFLVTKTRLPSFIATVGTMMIYRSSALVLSGGVAKRLGTTTILTNIMGGGKVMNFIPVPILWLLIITAVMWIILHKTTFGFKVYTTGGNINAATMSGIRTDRIKITNFILTSSFAGLTGIIALCYMGTTSFTMGLGYELEAIASTVIGGTALSGGIGSILGAFFGSFIFTEIRNGLVINMVKAFHQTIIIGAVIIIAFIINIQVTRAD
jgi:ribose/xylose/arabinose/galactoside ABC-type transport system permease subunit